MCYGAQSEYKPPPIWYLQLFRNLDDYTIKRNRTHQLTDFSMKYKIDKLGSRRSVAAMKNYDKGKKGKKNKLLISGYFG